MKNNFLVFIAVFINAIAIGQNGKLVSIRPFLLPDSSVQQIQKLLPETKTWMNNVECSRISYLSDGLKVNGFMASPKKPGKYPCVIYNRGGNRELGQLNEMRAVRLLGTVASWGYVVVASQYRGNDGGEGKEEFGGADVNDILNLIPFLSNLPNADTSRIGMYGWSRGGMMTYLALARTNRIKAAVIGAGLSDAVLMVKKRPEMGTNVFAELAKGYNENKDSVLKSRSVVYWPEKLCKTSPLLLLQGSADWRVSPDDAFGIMHKLYEIKHPFRFILFEGGQHSLTEHSDEVNHAAKNFLDTYVRDKQPWPDMQPHGD